MGGEGFVWAPTPGALLGPDLPRQDRGRSTDFVPVYCRLAIIRVAGLYHSPSLLRSSP